MPSSPQARFLTCDGLFGKCESDSLNPLSLFSDRQPLRVLRPWKVISSIEFVFWVNNTQVSLVDLFKPSPFMRAQVDVNYRISPESFSCWYPWYILLAAPAYFEHVHILTNGCKNKCKINGPTYVYKSRAFNE